MKPSSKRTAAVLAILAAVFYAINIPFSKRLMEHIDPTVMASLLYMGARLGVAMLYCFNPGQKDKGERFTRKDLPYTVIMLLLDILAPICLMMGVSLGTAADASLLGNFEIVATTLIALRFFHEKVSGKLWAAIALITVASILLSFDGASGLSLSVGSLFVLLATCCWGLENNCTRMLSGKNTYRLVIMQSFFSCCGSMLVALFRGERLPAPRYALWAMLLGAIAYGLSIFLYIRAQRTIGAAKTSAFYAIGPFVGGGLSLAINGEKPTLFFAIALCVMIAGTVLVVKDTLDNGKAE